MASTTALFTGLSGLNAHARSIDVIGNNIANINTTAYKSSRMVFADMLSRNISLGSPATAEEGGTNPSQVGLGVSIAGTQLDFTNGTLKATGNPQDMAIDGNGMFVVQRGDDQFYTRAGEFRRDANSNLTTIYGDQLLGFAVDDQFVIQEGTLAPISIPLGSMTIAQATTEVRLSGNLNANGTLPTQGSVIRLGGTDTAGLSLISTATVPPTAPNVLESTSLLTEIEDPLDPGSDTPLFASGQLIELDGVRKGEASVPTAQFTIAADSTVDDLMTFLTEALGIQSTGTTNPDGKTPGVSLDPATGELTVVGNTGTISNTLIESTDIRLLDSSGSIVRFPINATQLAEADGESVRTTLVAYDSLGTPIELDASFALESKGDAGTTWRYFLESADDSDLALGVGTGTVTFDPFGAPSTTTPVTVSIDRAGTGAASPLEFQLALAGGEDGLTALTDVTSQIAATYRDGAPIGTLQDFSVARDGTILGAFSNTLVKPLGRIALAVFTNPAGLEDLGSNLFRPGANSGQAIVTNPGQLSAGDIVGGSLEQSNVDLGQEFIDLVLASTGYSASSRVIRTTDQLIQELLLLAR